MQILCTEESGGRAEQHNVLCLHLASCLKYESRLELLNMNGESILQVDLGLQVVSVLTIKL